MKKVSSIKPIGRGASKVPPTTHRADEFINTDVALHFKKRAIVVHVRDDGEGSDIEEAISSKDGPRGLGLLGMKERIELTNGTLSIRSRPGGGSTKIDVEIPLNYEVPSG